jgi:hypothetical protein
MALYAFDGTWNAAKEGDEQAPTNTNVVRFFQAYHQHSGTNDFYLKGVGTRFGAIGKALGGAFGLGELPRINEAYDQLCKNWAAGDTTIDIVGFSRGAATTLDFCHCVMQRGIRKPGSDAVVEPRPRIRFLGVWDVVAAFGLGNLGDDLLNIGHHLSLPKSNLQYCFHAMALDERRPSFLNTRLPGACEVWFRGVHSDVGGGNGNTGLNDIALKWMMSKAEAAGLPIAAHDIAALKPDANTAPQLDLKEGFVTTRVVDPTDRRHYTVSTRDDCENPPETCPVETPQDETAAIGIGDELSVLPPVERARIAQLTERAVKTAAALGFSLDPAFQSVFSLIEHRVVFVKNDADQEKALASTQKLIERMVVAAKKHGFVGRLNDFFLTEAIFELRPLFPFAD